LREEAWRQDLGWSRGGAYWRSTVEEVSRAEARAEERSRSTNTGHRASMGRLVSSAAQAMDTRSAQDEVGTEEDGGGARVRVTKLLIPCWNGKNGGSIRIRVKCTYI
jgi:hypothetical protein